MNNTLKNRLDFFLAKIAGRDVNLGTLHPAVATSTTEELMLEVANRLNSTDTATQPFTVTVTYSSDTYSSDKTYAQIKAAIDDGRRIEFINDNGAYGTLVGVDNTTVTFHATDDNQGGSLPVLRTYEISASGVDYYSHEIVNVPINSAVIVDMNQASNLVSEITLAISQWAALQMASDEKIYYRHEARSQDVISEFVDAIGDIANAISTEKPVICYLGGTAIYPAAYYVDTLGHTLGGYTFRTTDVMDQYYVDVNINVAGIETDGQLAGCAIRVFGEIYKPAQSSDSGSNSGSETVA